MTKELQQWEYKVIGLTKKETFWKYYLKHEDVQEALNMMGKAGWQLSSAVDTYTSLTLIFKRPKTQPQ